MKKLTIIISLFLCISYVVKAQDVLLERNVVSDSTKRNWGPNLANYMHFYGAFGFIIPDNQYSWSPIYFGKASNWEFGLRYKRRITNWLAVGGNIAYDFFNYRMEQSSFKTLPDTKTYDKQKITMHNLSLQPFIRFNFGRRGNKIGNYIDVGFFYNAILASKEKEEGTPSGIDKVVIKNPTYMPSDYYGFFTNIGMERLVIYAKYNYQGIIRGDSRYMDLPPLTIGVQIGFF